MLWLFEASGAIHYDLVELDKAKISDLDMGQVGEYFTRYHISFLEESEEERQRLMFHADILGQNNKPTVAGLLIFGLSPERIFPASGISFAHFSGRDIVEKLIDKKNIYGKLPLQVENCLAAINANLLTGSTLKGAKRINVPSYPDTVFRELIVNRVKLTGHLVNKLPLGLCRQGTPRLPCSQLFDYPLRSVKICGLFKILRPIGEIS